jgi:hypothetical protein
VLAHLLPVRLAVLAQLVRRLAASRLLPSSVALLWWVLPLQLLRRQAVVLALRQLPLPVNKPFSFSSPPLLEWGFCFQGGCFY